MYGVSDWKSALTVTVTVDEYGAVSLHSVPSEKVVVTSVVATVTNPPRDSFTAAAAAPADPPPVDVARAPSLAALATVMFA